MAVHTDLFENLRIELRSGCVVLAALAALRHEHYGYTLRKTLADSGLNIEENTLYPMLRRLEKQCLLISEWREENNRKKRFYKLSRDGARILKDLFVEWDTLQDALTRIRGDGSR